MITLVAGRSLNLGHSRRFSGAYGFHEFAHPVTRADIERVGRLHRADGLSASGLYYNAE